MKILKLLHLYPDRMNIYGDMGNVICLMQRLAWRGYRCEYITASVGESLPKEYDLIFMGGGQDTGQLAVGADLLSKKHSIADFVASGGPALTICGGYQLFGKYFVTSNKDQIEGIDVFDVVTIATELRMIGNVVCESELLGTIVGFENHSGKTELQAGATPFAQVKQGYGNDGESGEEGVLVGNAIGTYLHGPLLPRNPLVADFLLTCALQRAGDNEVLKPLDDELATAANRLAQKFRQ